MIILLNWIDGAADVLSILTFFAAVYTWWQIRKLAKRYRGLIRIPEQVGELKDAASEIVAAAPDAGSNPDAVLGPLSTAEGKLASLQGKIGSKYSFRSTRRELVLEILQLKDELAGHQARGAPMNTDIATDAYRKISKVAGRITNHSLDQRLER